MTTTNTAVATQAAVPPQPVQHKKISEIASIDEMLKHPQIVERFKQALPKHLSTERMLRVCSMSVFQTPELGKCDLMSLTGAMLQLASLGLEPNTPMGHAYLIPFKIRKKVGGQYEDRMTVQIVIGYRGFIELARRSGNLVSIHADVVYEGDVFDFEYGTNMHLQHKPTGNDRTPIWAYAHAALSDGQAFEVLPYNRVLKIRNSSQGYIAALASKAAADKNPNDAWKLKSYNSSPWVAFEHEMAAKTMIRRLAKMLPMSIEFMRAADLDTLAEDRVLDYASIMAQPVTAQATILENLPIVDTDDEAAEPAAVKVEPAAAAPAVQEAKPRSEPTPAPASAAPAASAPVTQTESAPIAAGAVASAAPRPRGRPRKDGQPAGQAAAAVAPSPPPPPPPPPPAEPEPEPAAVDEPELDGAFELISTDGEPLVWDEDADFPTAVEEEMGKAFQAGGPAMLRGWIETNQVTLDAFPEEWPALKALADGWIARVEGSGSSAPAAAAPVQDALDIPPSLDRRTPEQKAAPAAAPANPVASKYT